MIFQITQQCMMECSHCIMDSTPDGKHMDLNLIGQSLKMIKELKPLLLLISGGEPTLHPNFLMIYDECLKIMNNDKNKIIVLSNGTFVENEYLTKEILKREMHLQITNDSRYYPHKLEKTLSRPNILYNDYVAGIFPMGRARKNNLKATMKSPSCFNFLSVLNSMDGNTLTDVNSRLENMGKFCYLAIQHDGNIRIGEGMGCHIIGNVSIDDIYTTFNNAQKIKTTSCNKCGLMDNLSPFLKARIDIK